MPLHRIAVSERVGNRRRIRDRPGGPATAEISPPGARLRRAADLQSGARRIASRRQLPSESGDLLHDLVGAGSAPVDGRVDRQEHDRQGRVSADRRDREPLRAHDRRSLARAGRLEERRLLDHRIERGLHARRTGAEMAMAQAAHRRRQALCEAELRLRAGAGVLGKIRAIFRRRNSPGAARGRRAGAAARGSQQILRREYDRRRRRRSA